MSKINEIDEIAQYQADVILETLKEQVEWSIADYDLSGDDYYNSKRLHCLPNCNKTIRASGYCRC